MLTTFQRLIQIIKFAIAAASAMWQEAQILSSGVTMTWRS